MPKNDQYVNENTITSHDAVDANGYHPSKVSSFFAYSEKLSSSKYLRWLMIAVLPILILQAYPVDRIDYDLWWQMAHGKYYITHHTLKMDISIFSWTPTDPAWIYNTCLGSIAIYLFYNFMGGFGLWLFQWLIFGGVFLSFYLFLRLINQRLDINSVTIIAVIAIACSITCRYYKPELFSAFLFCWTAFIFFYIKVTRKKFLFYLYPLLFVFWVNLHGAFVVGLVFLAMAFTGEVLNRIFFSKESFTTENLFHFGISLVLSLAATLINPYGIDYLKSLLPLIMNSLNVQNYSGPYDKFILAYVSLWPYLKSMSMSYLNFSITAWVMTIMIFSIFGLSLYELIKKRSFDFTLLIISLVFYWKGMETVRSSYFFLVVFFFFFFYLLIYRLKFKNILATATIFSLLIFNLFFLSIDWFNARYNPNSMWFGAGLDSFVPVEEVAFLKKYHLEGPIFNDYVIGGYLTWDLYPDYKVFIDPRGGLYGNQVFPDYMEFTMKHVNIEDISRFRKKYPFKIAILHYREMRLIFDFLRAGDEWRLLFFGKTAAILIHKSLVSIVQSELNNINLSPLRFTDIKDPEVLINVFNFYVNLDYEAGRYIYYVFEKNVSDYYKHKTELLQLMNNRIRSKEQESYNKIK